MRCYNELLDSGTMPISKKGSIGGFQYVFTKSLRPRNDPAGGGFPQERRLTYLNVQRDRTFAMAEVHTRYAGKRVNMGEVFLAVACAVEQWQERSGSAYSRSIRVIQKAPIKTGIEYESGRGK
jgi:hypothetical protein